MWTLIIFITWPGSTKISVHTVPGFPSAASCVAGGVAVRRTDLTEVYSVRTECLEAKP